MARVAPAAQRLRLRASFGAAGKTDTVQRRRGGQLPRHGGRTSGASSAET